MQTEKQPSETTDIAHALHEVLAQNHVLNLATTGGARSPWVLGAYFAEEGEHLYVMLETHGSSLANILADRLERLVAQGIFRTREHGSREYRLTEAGIDLYGILVALRDWADIWVQNRYRSPVQLIHKGCGQAFFARSSCTHCGVSVDNLSAIQFQRAVTI